VPPIATENLCGAAKEAMCHKANRLGELGRALTGNVEEIGQETWTNTHTAT
jgi:hypothetical protein